MNAPAIPTSAILASLNRAWTENQILHRDGQITLAEKAGRDAAIIYVAKDLGLCGAFIVSTVNNAPAGVGE